MPIRAGSTPVMLNSGRRSGITVPSGAAASTFTPLSLSPIVWYDFSDVTTLWKDTARTSAVTADGDAIAGITDKSGVGNHAAQATAGNRPLYKAAILNGSSVARLDAVNDFIASSAFVGGDKAQPNTLFVVGHGPAQNSANHIFTDGITSGKRHAIYIDDAGNHTFTLFAGGSSTGIARDISNHVLVGIFNGASSKIYKDGGAATTLAATGAQAMDGITVGAFDGTSGPLGGDVAEVLVYTGALSVANINLIGAYLGTKWGLTWSTAS